MQIVYFYKHKMHRKFDLFKYGSNLLLERLKLPKKTTFTIQPDPTQPPLQKELTVSTLAAIM